MVRRTLLLFVVASMSCGGKAQRPPVRRVEGPPSPPPIAIPSAEASPPEAASVERLAPRPRIRVGLTTRADVVRLTSSRPFRLGAGREWVTSHDVLVERGEGTAPEGWVYRVQVASFPSRDDAVRLRGRLEEDAVSDETVVAREAGTGRFALRLGAFPTGAGARALERELLRLGYEGLTIAREPSRVPRPRALVLRPAGQGPVRTSSAVLYALPAAEGAWIEVDGRPYRGYVELALNGSNRFTVKNVLNLEDYLKGVVPAELSPSAFPEEEALKAQAIAARTYAVKRMGEYEEEGYDICATPACQVYRGVSVEDRMASEAVRETSGEILTYEGEPVDALYTSTCGGRTENVENVFSSSLPYLVSRACFVEGRSVAFEATSRRPLPLEVAALSLLGVVEPSIADLAAEASYGEARLWTEKTVAKLGQRGCWKTTPSPPATVDAATLAGLLAEGLCWERRLPFLVSAIDASRLVSETGLSEVESRHLSFAIREGLVRPRNDGRLVGAALSRAELLSALYRVVDGRGEPPLREGTILSVEPHRLRLRDETLADEENEIVTGLAPLRYLYRSAAGTTYFARRLSLLPNDRVLFRQGDGGVDLLALRSEGGSFDRSSRFSHWVVRRSNADLTRDVNLRHDVGEIVDLRVKRYGRSGRVVELEIVGSASSTTVRGLAIRRALGIRENLFFFDAQRSSEGRVDSWVFTGRGWGHGVGLCQVGAYGMAAAGYGYRDILSHYYPGTRVERARLSVEVGYGDVDKARRAP